MEKLSIEELLIVFPALSQKFSEQYCKVLADAQKYYDSSCSRLILSANTYPHWIYPITDDNLYCIGFDKDLHTIWIFFDYQLADAN